MVRKIRAKLVLQLRVEGLSGRAIAASQEMSRKSITAGVGGRRRSRRALGRYRRQHGPRGLCPVVPGTR
jgi:hypothetical protein